jgi:hypothetical protein
LMRSAASVEAAVMTSASAIAGPGELMAFFEKDLLQFSCFSCPMT